jgi:hypothetical protein
MAEGLQKEERINVQGRPRILYETINEDMKE